MTISNYHKVCLDLKMDILLKRCFIQDGSLRDILYGTKPQQQFLRKYSVSKHKTLQLNDIRGMGWQILKALEFLHGKGLVHGSLHLGNIFLKQGNVLISGLTNFASGSSSRLRSYAVKVKAVSTLQDLDVYCFGHLLYEISSGQVCHQPSIDEVPSNVPDMISIYTILTEQLMTS